MSLRRSAGKRIPAGSTLAAQTAEQQQWQPLALGYQADLSLATAEERNRIMAQVVLAVTPVISLGIISKERAQHNATITEILVGKAYLPDQLVRDSERFVTLADQCCKRLIRPYQLSPAALRTALTQLPRRATRLNIAGEDREPMSALADGYQPYIEVVATLQQEILATQIPMNQYNHGQLGERIKTLPLCFWIRLPFATGKALFNVPPFGQRYDKDVASWLHRYRLRDQGWSDREIEAFANLSAALVVEPAANIWTRLVRGLQAYEADCAQLAVDPNHMLEKLVTRQSI